MAEHCLHEDRWESVQRDLSEVKQTLARDTTATWVRWSIPLVVTLVVTVYGFLQSQLDASSAYVQDQVTQSLTDRRGLASSVAVLDARQKEQFARILEELKRLNTRVEALQ